MMTTASTMTEGVNAAILALTPIERLQAIRGLGADFVGERSFVLMCGAALIVLTVLLVAVSYNRKSRDRTIGNQSFNAHAESRGLSPRERHILLEIATEAELKRSESIFTLASTYSRGAAKLTDEALVSQGAQASRRLNAELTFLRDKLGFQERASDSAGSAATPSKPSSRQIPTGKKLQIIRCEHEAVDIEATVIKNDDVELAVKLAGPLEADPRQRCSVHYYFGASVWEFDASVVSCHGGILVLTHSHDVRFVNRRRFLRVPVKKPAFIASFPFTRTLARSEHDDNEAAAGLSATWGPPDFVPAAVTELAGPGLRLEAPLEVQVGERVVVILKMREESDTDRRDALLQPGRKTAPPRILEDIGKVRHVRAIEDGFSIAVELTGLSDANVNELIRETNSASMEAGAAENGAPVRTAEQVAV